MKSISLITAAFVLISPQLLIAEPPVQQWAADFNGPAGGEDFSSAIAIDNWGNVYVTGRSDNGGAVPDYATIKYEPNGIQKWVARYNGQGNDFDWGKAIAADSQGNIYVTGESWSNETGFDYATIKYDPNGNQQWLARCDEQSNSDDYACALTLDNAGNVYVTGTSCGGETQEDYMTVKYEPNGNQKWIARYNGQENSFDASKAIAADSQGNIYVTGESWDNETGFDYATIKYNSDGNELWAVRYNGQENLDDYAKAIVLDDNGSVYVTGSSGNNTTGLDYATIKYDSNGTELWVAHYNGQANSDDYAQAVVLDGEGHVYVTGSSCESSTNYDYATIKYDPNGEQKWAEHYNGTENLDDYAYDAALDNKGNIYVAGMSCNGTSYDYAIIRYDPNGDQPWAVQYARPDNQIDDEPPAIAVDNIGNVYVTGCSYNFDTNNDYITIKWTQHNYCTLTSGDFSGNCKVDLADYAILAQDWPAIYDWEDLAELADNWLKCGFALQEDCS